MPNPSAQAIPASIWNTLKYLYLRRVVATGFLSAGLDRTMRWFRWVARNVYDLRTPITTNMLANLENAYGDRLSEQQREEIARGCFQYAAACFVDTVFSYRLLRGRRWEQFFEIPQLDRLRRLADEPRPILFVSTYLGNFNMGSAALARICGPLHAIIQPQHNPVLRRWQNDIGNLPGLHLVDKDIATRRMPGILEAGGNIMILGEHTRKPGRPRVVEFLGQQQSCLPTIAILSQRYDALVVPFINKKIENARFRFRLEIDLPIDPRDFPEQDATTAITRAYMSALERFILETPDQYLWTRRWVRK